MQGVGARWCQPQLGWHSRPRILLASARMLRTSRRDYKPGWALQAAHFFPLPHLPAADTHRNSDAPCPSDSCTPPSSGLGTASALPVATSAGTGPACAPTPQMLHAQAAPHVAGRQPQAGLAWPVQLMPGSMPGVPQMHPQLGMVQLVPVPMMAAANQLALPNGRNGTAKTSSRRQATNREAQKRYRCDVRGSVQESACPRLLQQMQGRVSPLCSTPWLPPAALHASVAGSGRRCACSRCR